MGGPHEGPYAAVATAFDRVGGPSGTVVPRFLLALLPVRRRLLSAGFLLVTYLGAHMLVIQGLKHLVDRPRRANPLVRVDHWLSDTAAGAAAGVGVGPLARWLCAPALLRERARVHDRRGAAVHTPDPVPQG
ncbi:hypothetical protein [Streptomyces sp. NPDC058623]|uniref:hypothetical protein n=1 Tax=Streptomyces sp. NPDC058623 TaxID=3346563 RepID=UPI0036570586